MISTYTIQDALNYLPQKLKDLPGWFIAGGAASTISSTDIDIYFETEQHFLQAVEVMKTAKRLEARWGLENYDILNESDNAITYSNAKRLQLVRKHFGQPLDVISTFDLNICRNAILPSGELISHPTAHLPMFTRTDSTLAYSTANRYVKYLLRGFIPDLQKFNDLVLLLANNPQQECASDYEGHSPTTYLDLLYTLASQDHLSYFVFKALSTLPDHQNLQICKQLIYKNGYYPYSHISLEFQTASCLATNKTTPEVLAKYPELFL